jgi:nucleoside-diphosphate-sugar epimerase
MKLAVTGGSGKLGQWVVRELVDAADDRVPHEVTVFDLVTGPPLEGVRYLVGDVQDLGQVVGAMAGADAVIHLAAYPRPGLVTDEVTFRTNVMGTFNVHEAAWRLGIRRVVSTSSVAPLGFDFREREFLPDYLPFDEDHPLRPQDPYGLSKEVGEAIARSYTARCGMVTVVLRPPGLMTPEQMAEIRRDGGRPVTRFALYSYVDLRDLARAYRLAVERPLDGCHVLFVAADDSGVAEPLADLYPRLLPSLGDRARDLTGSRPSVSNARAKAVLGWQPRYTWRQAEDGDDGG